MSSTLRSRMQNDLKSAMRAREALRVSTLRMMIARLKDIDIASRPKGAGTVPEAEIVAMLRGMVKSRRESETLYRHGCRPDLAAKEAAEIVIIEEYLPRTLNGAELDAAIAEAIGTTGAAAPKDMGKVIAALKEAHGPALDMASASAAVKAKLSHA
ncbi:GatB/YqeY domain-containing protein [Acidiphilium sp. AL]|uniref:GatB/YqeY domain-containing protein n=1 Tax=Acidiphilium iwatense TaxID=768198 RepID=A0ABS9DW63_9PROT|nr:MULTISPECIES: GatB/YqeY domain-containing protein [Acidiphilium]MCF3946980.1 GatB/YqeY domain-containing protein [Acidiphilium iwatense]MCU4160344.1 GatB/YqeY domain-containing protein [Acidiphilium sp. AL]